MFRRILCASLVLVAACNSTSKEKSISGQMAAIEEKKRKPDPRPPLDSELPSTQIHRTARKVSFKEMLDDFKGTDVVFVGENHNQPAHHEVQLRIIEYLYALGRLHGIGMEMFQREFQPALTAYVEGRISEDEMIEQTEFKKRWRYYDQYRAILAFAREKRLPVVALNVATEVRDAIREGPAVEPGQDPVAGYLAAVPEELRRDLPPVDITIEEHRARIKPTYDAHREFMKIDFDRYYFLMCLWDDYMAESIVRWYATAPKDAQMVVLAGGQHVAYRNGIPERMRRKTGKKYQVVVAVTEGRGPDPGDFATEHADYVWVVPAPEKS